MSGIDRLIPTGFNAEYQSRTDEQLLQLWVERSELLPEAEVALQNEIARRGLTREAATAKDRRVEDDSDHEVTSQTIDWLPPYLRGALALHGTGCESYVCGTAQGAGSLSMPPLNPHC